MVVKCLPNSLKKIDPSLFIWPRVSTVMATKTLIHSCLDYCNRVLAHPSIEKCKRSQSVLKSAARLIFQMPGRASVTDLIRSKLHWLSFPERVTYKLCVLSYKCLHGTASDYLSQHLVSTSTVPGRTRLRSATVCWSSCSCQVRQLVQTGALLTVAWNQLQTVSWSLWHQWFQYFIPFLCVYCVEQLRNIYILKNSQLRLLNKFTI